MIEIRPGLASDAPAIARVRRESWHAAYAGIISARIIDRVTTTGGSAADPPPYRRTLVALAGDHPAVIGYASYGPERTVASVFPARPASAPASAGQQAHPSAADPLTPAGRAGAAGELYALYVTPAWWSAGAGRALMGSVLTALEAERYRRVVLWVLADNARARRFYELAGFASDGGTNILTGLGGLLELRYTRPMEH